MEQNKRLLGDFILEDIEANGYLRELYNELVIAYTKHLYELRIETSKVNVDHLLRFADILSKSNHSRNEQHHNLAQSIMALLSRLRPDDKKIEYYFGSVLTNVNNYKGAANRFGNYYNTDLMDFVSEFIEKESHRIPMLTGDREEYFFGKQKYAFQRMQEADFYSYSGPTSMGKTFLIKMFIRKRIESGHKENFVIIVPTKALINEITSDFINDFKDYLAAYNFRVANTPGAASLDQEYNFILIYTQERFLYHLIKHRNVRPKYVFIDEAHKISERSSRSAFFYKIIDILRKGLDTKVIFSCPGIPNPEVYLNLISKRPSMTFYSDRYIYSPVSQQKYLIDARNVRINIYNDLSGKFIKLPLDENLPLDTINVIRRFGKDGSSIIYCESTEKAIDLARRYADGVSDIDLNEELKKVIDEIKAEIHTDYYLVDFLAKGVAYHVGYLPANIREKLEHLFRMDVIKALFCTSTLLEGVNLPASNLFIIIKKDSPLFKTPANFKNLVGRVGRIKYNLMGNVFIVPESGSDETVIDKCQDVIEHDTPEQTLSIDQILKKGVKDKIISLLERGETTLEKRGMNFEEYNFIRFTLNSLLNDILQHNTESIIYNQFSDMLDRDTLLRIQHNFQAESGLASDDVILSFDQLKNANTEIQNGLSYPTEIIHDSILKFLERLFDLYNWELYESKKDIGNKERLKYYAVLLGWWMRGDGLGQIIRNEIDWARSKGVIYVGGEKRDYRDNKEDRNIIINKTLSDIDNVILFKISNYFLKFSEQYMRFHSVGSIANDWYEFVEYGTQNADVINLQKIGFTREVANKVLGKYGPYISYGVDGRIRLHPMLKKVVEGNIRKETLEVYHNNTNVFLNG